jgi:hypothetical protein
MIKRRQLTTAFGLGCWLVAWSAVAATGLRVEVVTRDLAPGTKVWLEVQPAYHQLMRPASPAEKALDSGVLQQAKGESIWQFDTSGKDSPIAHDFSFPVDLDQTTGSGHLGVIMLETRFRIDAPGSEERVGYGRVHEMTFAMPVLGAAPLTRCLRLREAGGRLLVESAVDCRDSSFKKSTQVHLPPAAP